MVKIGKIAISFFLLFGFVSAWAGVQVAIRTDSKEIGLDETLTVTVSVSSEDDFEADEPRSPDFEGFQLLNTWVSNSNSSRLVQGANGMHFESSKTRDFNFQLAPRKKGSFPIGSFEVVVNGRTFRTSPVVIRVVEASAHGGGRAGNGGRQAQPEDDPFQAMQDAEDEIFRQLLQSRQRLLQQGGGGAGGFNEDGEMLNPAVRTTPKNPNEAFFIQVEVDKDTVYEGEQITVNWYLYTRGQMESLDRLKFPSLKGFWKEIIEEVPSIQFREEVLNGVPYRKALLASHALFPIKAGIAVIDEFKIKSRVRMPSQGFGGFWGKPYEYTKTSQPVKITVKPLPTEGRPSDFSGAVGEFDVQAAIDGNGSYPVNQPFSMRLRFEGAGNAKLIELPALNLPSNLEVYDTKSDAKFFKNGRSYKEFEVLVIPRETGDITIPEIKVSFFDPKTGKYYSRNSLPITLRVVDNPNAPVGSASPLKDWGSSKKEVVQAPLLPPAYDLLDEAQATPSALAQFSTVNPIFWWPVFGGVLLTLLVRASLILGWGRKEKTVKDVVRKRLKKAQRLLQDKNQAAYSAEMLNIWYQVLGKASENQGASMTVEKLLENLSPSLRRDYGSEITKSIDFYQMLCFAPSEVSEGLFKSDRLLVMDNESTKLIDKLLAEI